MKKPVVIVVVAAVVIAAVVYHQQQAPGADLEVDCYLRLLKLPAWTPLSRGYTPGTIENPQFISMRNDRYFVMIVSMPARRLLALDTDEAGEPIYPQFKLTLTDGRVVPAKRVTAWPNGKHFSQPEDFADPESWTPKPGDKPNKRYRLAVMWRLVVKQAQGPYELQTDDDPPIHVPKSKYDTFVKY